MPQRVEHPHLRKLKEKLNHQLRVLLQNNQKLRKTEKPPKVEINLRLMMAWSKPETTNEISVKNIISISNIIF